MGVGSQRHAPAAPYPREKLGTHCIGGWVGLRAGLDRCGKSRPPQGFDPRTVQPVASRYTVYAIAAPLIYVLFVFIVTPSRWYLDAETRRRFFYIVSRSVFVGIYIECLIHFQVHQHTPQLEEVTLIVRVMYTYVGKIKSNVYIELDF